MSITAEELLRELQDTINGDVPMSMPKQDFGKLEVLIETGFERNLVDTYEFFHFAHAKLSNGKWVIILSGNPAFVQKDK